MEIPAGKAIILLKEPFTAFNQIGEFFKTKPSNAMQLIPVQKLEKALLRIRCKYRTEFNYWKNCHIHPNVTIRHDVNIGDNVIIQSGSIIGSDDAFYYKEKREQGFERLKSSGICTTENKVEIGANCTIDRGVSGETRIGEGTVLDNLIQIGHDIHRKDVHNSRPSWYCRLRYSRRWCKYLGTGRCCSKRNHWKRSNHFMLNRGWPNL